MAGNFHFHITDDDDRIDLSALEPSPKDLGAVGEALQRHAEALERSGRVISRQAWFGTLCSTFLRQRRSRYAIALPGPSWPENLKACPVELEPLGQAVVDLRIPDAELVRAAARLIDSDLL